MSNKPIFVATHPRACSTAFERVFMTQRDTLQCIHEPFGDAFYYGPERLSPRFENDEETRLASGFSQSTYKTIVDRIEQEAASGKRVFIKDIIYYLFPPEQQVAKIAPSLNDLKRGVGTESSNGVRDSGIAISNGASGSTAPFPYATESEPGNPTIIPSSFLGKYHFTFLIRHPRSSIPSYYRCCVPPLVDRTGFEDYMPAEAGYDEVRRFFEYCRSSGLVGPRVADNDSNGSASSSGVEICVVDADDLLDNPEGILRKYCKSVGLEFKPSMLVWDDEASHEYAKETFEKWDGFHDDAIHSKDLKPRQHKSSPKSDEQLYAEWTKKFGAKGAETIKKTVAANVADYEYLKQFAIQA